MTEPQVHHLPRLGLASAMRLYGLTARALRFYEERGLIEARRDRLNARFYDPDARRRLDWIVPLRKAGVSLEDIRDVLRAEEEEGRGQDCALRAVARREAELEAQLSAAKAATLALQTAPAPAPRRIGLAGRG